LVAVWLYRKLTDSRGVSTSLVSLSGQQSSMRVSAQQGFVRLNAQGTQTRNKRSVTTSPVRRRSNVGVLKPWGW
jgi:hypothetical protein